MYETWLIDNINVNKKSENDKKVCNLILIKNLNDQKYSINIRFPTENTHEW